MSATTTACRRCGKTGRGVHASLVPGEYVCGSLAACERRQAEALRGAYHGGWGTSPKWPRKLNPVRDEVPQ